MCNVLADNLSTVEPVYTTDRNATCRSRRRRRIFVVATKFYQCNKAYVTLATKTPRPVAEFMHESIVFSIVRVTFAISCQAFNVLMF